MSVVTRTQEAYEARVRESVPRIREEIVEAARRGGRDDGEEVRIVAVTKGHPLEAVRAAVSRGLEDLGENRVGELEHKVASAGREGVRWHMIGHLQRRKAPRILGICDLLHSLDSLKLAERLERVASREEVEVPVLVQLNTSGEESKYGIPGERALDVLGPIVELPSLDVRGLMTMAPLTDDPEVLRATFRGLGEVHRAALDQLPGYRGSELSMGMTNDYEIAVEEGSTMVRLGTAIFGERPE